MNEHNTIYNNKCKRNDGQHEWVSCIDSRGKSVLGLASVSSTKSAAWVCIFNVWMLRQRRLVRIEAGRNSSTAATPSSSSSTCLAFLVGSHLSFVQERKQQQEKKLRNWWTLCTCYYSKARGGKIKFELQASKIHVVWLAIELSDIRINIIDKTHGKEIVIM